MGEHDLVGVDVQEPGESSPGFDESGLVGHLMEQVGIQFYLALQIQCSLENWSWRGPVGALERSEHKWMGFSEITRTDRCSDWRIEGPKSTRLPLSALDRTQEVAGDTVP